ncbi:MAG: hypothetical protein ACYC5Y_10605 [Symbiobacteriia bacterium]
MSDDEAKAIMDAVLGGMKELKGAIDGLTHQVAHLAQRISALEVRVGALEERMDRVETRLGAVERGLADLKEEVHEGLTHLGERWLEHDRAIHKLKHTLSTVPREA